MFVKLHERLGADQFAALEQIIIDQANDTAGRTRAPSVAPDDKDDEPPSGRDGAVAPPANDSDSSADDDGPARQGRFIVDASVAEQKIRYPTNVSLLMKSANQLKPSWMTYGISYKMMG